MFARRLVDGLCGSWLGVHPSLTTWLLLRFFANVSSETAVFGEPFE
jgi:hypothetical protein